MTDYIKPDKRTVRILVCILAVCLPFFVFFLYKVYPLFNPPDYAQLVQNYQQKKREIYAVKQYMDSINPVGRRITIEFEDSHKLAIFHIDNDLHWDIEKESPTSKYLLHQLEWTEKTLSELHEKLDQANCISVESGEVCKIGFQRSGMGKYFYNLFNHPVSKEHYAHYNDSCTYIMHTSTVIFEYGGGAFGNQCFPDFRYKR